MNTIVASKHTDIRTFQHKGITIDAGRTCTLECPKCMREKWIDKRLVPGQNLSKENFLKLVDYFKSIDFCGQISDPIFNPWLIDFLRICNERNKPVSIHTAASQKSMAWYNKAFDANKNTKWIFGVDGLPEESCMYRVHQDGEKLFEVMKMGVQKGLKIYWQYIKFRYNQHNIEEAKQLAKKNNIYFILNESNRWDGPTDPFKPI